MPVDQIIPLVVISIVSIAVAIYERKVPEYIRRPYHRTEPDPESGVVPFFKVTFTRPNDETANLPEGWRMEADWGGEQALLRDMAQKRQECEAMVKECGVPSIDSLPIIDKPALLVIGLFMVWLVSTQAPYILFLLSELFRGAGWAISSTIGTWFARLIGWTPDDWLMFRVFYEYYLIYDWDGRTFKHLIRRPGGFWGMAFGGLLKALFYGGPPLAALIVSGLYNLDMETLKAFVRKCTPTFILWGVSVGVFRYLYPYYVWWPRPILYLDYFFLLLGSAAATTAFSKIKAFLWEDLKAVMRGDDPTEYKKSKVDK